MQIVTSQLIVWHDAEEELPELGNAYWKMYLVAHKFPGGKLTVDAARFSTVHWDRGKTIWRFLDGRHIPWKVIYWAEYPRPPSPPQQEK